MSEIYLWKKSQGEKIKENLQMGKFHNNTTHTEKWENEKTEEKSVGDAAQKEERMKKLVIIYY